MRKFFKWARSTTGTAGRRSRIAGSSDGQTVLFVNALTS